MKTPFYILLFALCTLKAIAQSDKQSNIWYFGESAGLDFNSGSPPTTLTNGQVVAQFRNSSTLCDENGNLLLYSDGESVWNKYNRVIPGAIDIGGSSLTFTQNGVIIPHPKFGTQFYVLSIPYTTNGISDILYTLIDLSLNNGEGGVIFQRKVLATSLARTMVVVRHCNNHDFWLLTHEPNTNNFRAYLVDDNGINTTPIISSFGAVNQVKIGTQGNSFFLRASLDGKKIAASQPNIGSNTPNFLEIFNFDNKTGKITALVREQTWLTFNTGTMANDMVFTADNRFMYVTRTFQFTDPAIATSTFTSDLFQIDLSKNPSDINCFTLLASRKYVRDPPQNDGPNIKGITALQIGPDGKIYVGFNLRANLSVINIPSNVGLSCGFALDAIDLDARKMGWGLPSLLPPKSKDIKVVIATKPNPNACNDILEAKTTGVSPDTKLNYQWYLNNVAIKNATDSVLTVTQSGKYFLMVEEANGCRSAKSNELDFVVKTVPLLAPKINAIAPICVGEPAPTLSATGSTIKWYEDKTLTQFIAQGAAVKPNINTNSAQKYTFWATQSNGNNCISPADSVVMVVNSKPVISLISHKIPYCLTANNNVGIKLTNNESVTYQWIFNKNIISTQNPLQPTQYGNYLVIATNKNGCIAKDSAEVVEACFQIHIPDIFTPNGDTFNDHLVLSGLGISNFDLQIYSHWGEVLLSIQKQEFNTPTVDVWDGTLGGKSIPDGTYPYLLTLRRLVAGQELNVVKKGVVVLVR